MLRSLICGMLLAGACLAAAADYVIQPAPESRFALEIYKTGLMSGKKHLFLFSRYEGVLRYDPDAPEASGIRLEVDAASAVCKDDWVTDSQRDDIEEYALEEMMVVKQYPKILFVSDGVTGGGGRYEVTGTLTIRGRGRPAKVQVELQPGEDGRLRFQGSAVVNLKEYGIKPRRAALGLIGTKNEMELRFDLVATPRPAGE